MIHSGVCFLDLPRELRDRIYYEVWRFKTPFNVTYKGVVFSVKQRTPRPWNLLSNKDNEQPKASKPTKRSPWFLASHQVLREAIEQFHRNSVWQYQRSDLFSPESSLQSSRLLLDPWKAHTLVLGGIGFKEQCTVLIEDDFKITYTYSPDEMFEEQLGHHLDTASNLRKLELSFTLGLLRTPVDRNPVVNINFGTLEQLNTPGLQEVDISVIWAVGYDKGNRVAIDRFRERLLELGKHLMKNKGPKHISSNEDSIDDDSDRVPLGPYPELQALHQPKWLFRFTK